MNNFMFSLNATLPIFFTMALGMFFKRVHLFNKDFVDKLNRFVFVVALPILLFSDISKTDFIAAWDFKFVAFCFLATVFAILISFFISFRFKQVQGEFVQASYRSSAAILGIAFIQNIYGNSGMAPLMIVATVPLYNIVAVIVLSLMKPDHQRLNREIMITTIKSILTNPILIGIAIGVAWSLLNIPQPVIMQKTLGNIGVLATPLGLMAMGGSFEFKKVWKEFKPVLICTLLKLIVFVAILLPIAICLGFMNDKLVAILVSLGSATTVSSFVMAKNMGHEGTLSSGVVMLSTLVSAITLTMWLFVLKNGGWI